MIGIDLDRFYNIRIGPRRPGGQAAKPPTSDCFVYAINGWGIISYAYNIIIGSMFGFAMIMYLVAVTY